MRRMYCTAFAILMIFTNLALLFKGIFLFPGIIKSHLRRFWLFTMSAWMGSYHCPILEAHFTQESFYYLLLSGKCLAFVQHSHHQSAAPRLLFN